ncbi:MAG: S24 family peptidase [Balneola sp.]
MSTYNSLNAKNILRRLKTELNLSTDTQLADLLGKVPSTLSTWKKRNSLDYELVLALCEKYGMNYSWIFHGVPTEELGRVNTIIDKKSIDGIAPRLNEPLNDYDAEFSQVEYYPQAYASAGHGLIAEEKAPLYLSFRKYFINNTLNSSAKDLVVLRVKGDSMEPEIMSDDDILVDRSRNKPRFGPAYLIRLDDVLHCKLIQTFGEERWRIMSKNPSYESFDINPKTDPIEIIGEVVWWGRKSKYL